MSTLITPVSSITADSSIQPTAGSTEGAVDGGTYVVTDPNTSGSNPTTIEAPATGSFSVAAGAVGSNVVIQGDGTATVNIGNAEDGTGELDASGSSFQVNDIYAGNVVANLSGAIVDGTKVDISTSATGSGAGSEGGTIASNLPGVGTDTQLDYYVNTGSGSDQIEGSRGVDFVRAGAGDDSVSLGAGDDIVRLGTGNDTATLGSGADEVYFTVDQLQLDGQTKTLTDFTSGEDKLSFAADAAPSITGYGTNTLTLTFTGPDGVQYTTTVTSGGTAITEDDVEFL